MYTLVTGGTGFIGRRLLYKLNSGDRKIRCLVRRNMEIPNLKNIEYITGDIKEPDSLVKAMQGVDVVYHLAARTHPSIVKPYKYYEEVNVQGTKNILEVALSCGNIKKIVLLSSIAATGPSRDSRPLNEDSPLRPITNYGKSKVQVEKLARKYYEKYALPVVVIRPPMVYGIGDKDWVYFFKIIKKKSENGNLLPVPGNHNNLFDYCFVDNLVDGLIKAEKNENTIG